MPTLLQPLLLNCQTHFLVAYIGKGKHVPVLKEAPLHEGVLGQWRYNSTHSLTSALDGGEWSASRPGRFTPRGRAPGIHWTGGLVGPSAGLDVVSKRKIPDPRWDSNHNHSINQLVVSRYTDWATRGTFKFQKWESATTINKKSNVTKVLITFNCSYTGCHCLPLLPTGEI
jgi:hypothetical protein